MRHPVRRLAGFPAALLCSLLFLAPGAALADHDHRGRREHRHEQETFRQDLRPEIRTVWRWGPWLHHRHHARAAAYTCARCRHGFQRRNAFYEHVHHAHAVPLARLPFVLVHANFGWVFGD